MKCPNCRCVVPGSMKYCSYCGFRFENDSARTVSVTEAYSGRLYREPAYYSGYGWLQELTANQYAAYSGGDISEQLWEAEYLSFQLPVILLLGLCAVFLLFIIALLVLIL